MTHPASVTRTATAPSRASLPSPAEALADADRRLADAAACLGARVALGPSALIDDALIAQTGALLAAIARQVGEAQAAPALVALLAAQPALRDHCHALAIEWRAITALAARRAHDPVLSPLLRERLDPHGAGAEAAATAAALLATEVRWHDAMRRMHLPLADLPADLAQIARAVARAANAETTPPGEPAASAPARAALLARVLADLGDRAGLALDLDHAGLPLFVTALALGAGVARETVVRSLSEDSPLRLALVLRAAGLSRAAALAHLLALRSDAPADLIDAAADSAAAQAMLAGGAGA